jgi:nitrate/TMAO reductase-like tetraheme cytochrome c subunit
MTKKQYHCTVVAICVLALCGAAGYTMHATSSREFCLSCHEMQVEDQEQRYSSHAKDAQGQPIACAQCHLPPDVGPSYVAAKIHSGVKDLVVHWLSGGDPPVRARLQPTARRFIVDEACLQCHGDLYKDAKGKGPISELGKIAHDSYLGKNGQAKSNCAGCHINIAHLPEFNRHLDVNAAFASRILKKEEFKR